ncbi:MAG: hypothetical protein IJM79_04230 [Erysipelotrichaceae bacterium]|nr:hypothetical protein [Erysipelotrichaceae bacterium]
MGFLDKVKGAVTNAVDATQKAVNTAADITSKTVSAAKEKLDDKYVDKYQQYIGVDYTYNYEEYPNGTELINDFSEELEWLVNHNENGAASFLAKVFLQETIGNDVAEKLSSILGKKLGYWLKCARPTNLARLVDGKGGKYRILVSSENFSKWATGGVGTQVFYALYNATNELFSADDEAYINWPDAIIWDHSSYKRIRASEIVGSLGVMTGSSTSERVAIRDEAQEYFEKAVKDDMKKFYRYYNNDDDTPEPIDLSKF